MNNRVSVLALMILAGALPSHAQTPEPTPIPPPQPPFVAQPAPRTTYELKVSYADGVPSLPENQTVQTESHQPQIDRPVAVVVKLDSNSRHIVVNHANGLVSEGYLFESGFVIRSTANSNKTYVSTGAKGASAVMEMFTKDFQGTQWIERAHYQGVEKVDGVDCYVFFRPAEPMPTTQGDGLPPDYDPIKYMDLRAYIRVADKTPARVQLGQATYTFSTVTPWTGTITMPENFKYAAEDYSKQMAIIDALLKKRKQ